MVGGVYVYANVHGCDGDRVYYDGCPLIYCNGQLCAQGRAFTLDDTEVVHATVDLAAVDAFRLSYNARSIQAASAHGKPVVDTVDYPHLRLAFLPDLAPPLDRPRLHLHTDLEEIAYGPSAWLWDYLRRSGMGGFMLPLSGGADSAAVAGIVGVMCRRVAEQLRWERDSGGPSVVEAQLAKMLPSDHPALATPDLPVAEVARALAANFLTTCYMGCSIGSTEETRDRASRIADEIGGTHLVANIDSMVESANSAFSLAASVPPATFADDGERTTDSVALENVQARSRMVLAYLFAQRHASIRRRHGPTQRGLLVLASSNVDEALRGYLTKYDCSAADLNPIGAIAKGDLKRFLLDAAGCYAWPSLADAARATPSAELRPGAAQVDEVEMGVTYEELGKFGELRSLHRAGMVSAFIRLVREWGPGTAADRSPRDLADLVQRLFHYFAINRHKATVATPSYHAEYYSPDDNRFDQRQFLYPPSSAERREVEAMVAAMEADGRTRKK
jgi:NAD+ synthase (glutamine-hydrolysing)